MYELLKQLRLERLFVWSVLAVGMALLGMPAKSAVAQINDKAGVVMAEDTLSNPTLPDSSCVSPLRPRRGTYLIETYPSPALPGTTINVQVYNHNPDIFSVRIVDLLDRTVKVLQPKEALLNDLHKYQFQSFDLASAKYFIRLTTYTESGAIREVQDASFIILH
jgi:hypothetical protein